MSWLTLTSYRSNRKKYTYVMLSLMLTTFLATISISSLEFAASVWRKPLLMLNGGHVLIYYSPDGPNINAMTDQSRVFDGGKARRIVKDVFPEASTTSQLLVPATYINEIASMNVLSRMNYIVGRSDNLDSWYLAPETLGGLSLAAIPENESTIVCGRPYPHHLPDATIRIAEYVGGDHPWQLAEAEARTVPVAGTAWGGSREHPTTLSAYWASPFPGCSTKWTMQGWSS